MRYTSLTYLLTTQRPQTTILHALSPISVVTNGFNNSGLTDHALTHAVLTTSFQLNAPPPPGQPGLAGCLLNPFPLIAYIHTTCAHFAFQFQQEISPTGKHSCTSHRWHHCHISSYILKSYLISDTSQACDDRSTEDTLFQA